MEEIHSLIHSLTGAEWTSLRNYFTCFTVHDPSHLKTLQLAELLMKNEECPSDKYCCLKIYGVKSNLTFEKLKSRLKEKILDFLLTDISNDKRTELDGVDYMYIKIKKLLAQYQQLSYSKSRLKLIYSMLDEIIFLAKEYEYFFAVVESLKLKRGSVSWKISIKEFETISKELNDYVFKSQLLLRAEYLYYNLFLFYDFKGKPDTQKIITFLKQAILELSEGYALTKSPIINYYLKHFEMELFQLLKNYSQARSICLERLDIVRNNKSVYRRQRIGVVYDNLSRCEYYLNHYKSATEYAQLAQKHFNLNSENYCIALEQEFYALFAMKQYDKAVEIAHNMIGSAARKELGEFRFSKYNYLLANALFKQRKFHHALQLLSQQREIAKDKAGWEVGARTLTIITLIEMCRLDEASSAVRSLKRFFNRADKNTAISQRDKRILNLLQVAERNGFLFSTLNGNADKYMKMLSPSLKGENKNNRDDWDNKDHQNILNDSEQENSELKWEPFTHEVIPFHEWFAEKMGIKIKSSPDSAKMKKEKSVVLITR